MAISALLAGSLIGGGVNLAKGLFGAVQASKARKGINKLLANQPTYKRPEEYGQELAMRAGLASQNQPAWMRQAKSDIGGAFSQSLGASERGAISSNTYQKSVGDLFNKQIQAYQDLGMEAQKWQDTQKENYMKTLQTGAGYSDTEYEQNVRMPWDIRMNELTSQRQEGASNLWNGLEGMASGAMNYVGTKYYQDIMKGLQGGNGGGSAGFGKTPMKQPYTLGSQYSPKSNLDKTLAGMAQKVPINLNGENDLNNYWDGISK